jgi:hypothetical protein
MRMGETVEQPGADERRVGIVDPRQKRGYRGRPGRSAIAVGPGRALGQPGRPPPARGQLAEPDRRLLALAAQADQPIS